MVLVRNPRTPLILAVLLWGLAARSWAGDGQIDILPPGDAPLMIANSGSYVLVDNVTMTASANCIVITADNVSLDLNGHTIDGGIEQLGQIGIESSANRNIRVFNGAIRNFNTSGILLGDDCQVFDMIVTECGISGVEVGSHCTVDGVTALHCTGLGIFAMSARNIARKDARSRCACMTFRTRSWARRSSTTSTISPPTQAG